MENGNSDWSGDAACGEGLECFDQFKRLERFERAYSLSFICGKKTALLQFTMSSRDGIASILQRSSLLAVEHPLKTDSEVSKAAR